MLGRLFAWFCSVLSFIGRGPQQAAAYYREFRLNVGRRLTHPPPGAQIRALEVHSRNLSVLQLYLYLTRI